jgi:uncharacterized membrane protein YhaH (DUF805 family)
MEMINAFKSAFTNFATFSGRASRGAYWWYVLAYFLGAIVFGILDKALFGGSGSAHMGADGGMMTMSYTSSGVLGSIWMVANLVPSIAIAARRLHDTGRSGWMQLLVLIPILGLLYLVYVLIQKGTEGDNAHGADPLA